LSKYVIDAWAWIEYMIGSEHGAKVKETLENESNEIFTCAVTLAEIISKVGREGRNIEEAYALLLSDSQIINADEDLSKNAGIIHAQMRSKEKDFGLADAYVLASARKLKGKILTGDAHFKNLKEAVLINRNI
jgi:predicted nucleic acid-binding protein